jgi:hypothetical protein
LIPYKLFPSLVKPSWSPNNTNQKGLIVNSNDINKTFSRINKGLNEIDKEIKQHKKENQQQTNNSTLRMLALMSEDMQRHNANEKSIQLALKGTYEYFKIAANVKIEQSSINRLVHTENTMQQKIASYGTPLSEIATQQLTWLWEKRIPQGKSPYWRAIQV